MHTRKRTASMLAAVLTLAVLLGLSRALPAVATEYQASDYLPLAVGNSWTYGHRYSDRDADYSQWSTYTAQHPNRPQFTIEVLRTEELDGQTYYVISEQAIYRFDGADETGYTISTDEGDNRVTVHPGADPVPRYFFEFHADAYGDARQGGSFRAGYGYEKGTQLIFRDVHRLFTNQLKSIRAVLGGTTVEYEDALVPTSTSSSTWGLVKRSLLVHRAGEGTNR